VVSEPAASDFAETCNLLCSDPDVKAALAASGFTPQVASIHLGRSMGARLATDAHGHIYILFPQYGPVAQCPVCTAPTMVLLTSNDNGISWSRRDPC